MKKLLFIIVHILLASNLAYADEFGSGKASVTDSKIGSINGAGGSVGSAGLGIQTDEFSGAATFSVPIPLPPGRGGLAPKLILHYNSARKNPSGWVGYGWDLSLGSIVRTPKYGVVDYYEGTEFEVQLLGQTEQLKRIDWDVSPAAFGLSVKPGTTVDWYEARVDSSRNLYFHLYNKSNPEKIQDLGWVVIDKSGTRYEFGTFPGLNSSQDYSLSPDLKKTWVASWLLERVIDSNGNTIEIEYGIDQKPNKIIYGDIVIQFEKTGYEKLRFFPIFREGFFGPQKVSRLNAIEVLTKNNNVRLLRYVLVYTESTTNRSQLLTSINRFGATDAATLPSITLSYFGNEQPDFKQKPTVVAASAESGDKEDPFNPGYLNNYADIMDLDGDAHAELLLGFKNGTFVVRSISGVVNYGQPVELKDPLAGKCMDNYCWGLVSGVAKAGFFYDWAFVMDMNGDGAPDRVLRRITDIKKQARFLIAFGSPGKLGWDANLVEWLDPMADYNPGVEDHSAGLLDMNGDGLPDRIVGDSKVGGFNIYYNTGFGFSTKSVFWKDPLAVASPNHPAIAKLNAYDGDKLYVTVRDVTGDALPDRVYRTEFIAPDGSGGWKSEFGFHVAVNKNGLGWGQPILPKDPNVCPSGKTCTMVNSYDTLGMSDPLTIVKDRGYISSSTYDLMDFNNDGYADRIEGIPYTGDPSTGKIRITYFSGQEEGAWKVYFDPTTTVELDDPVFDDKSKVWAAAGYLSRRYTDPGYQFTLTRDVNGDGYPDRLIWTPRSKAGIKEQPYVQRSIEIHPFIVNSLQFSTLISEKTANQPVNALKEIDNGEGMKTAVEYIQSTDPDLVKNRYLPTPTTLVHRLYRTDTDAPIDSSPEGKRHPGMRWASYYYEGGNLYLRFGKPNSGPGPNLEYQSKFNGFQNVTKWYEPLDGETWQAYSEETKFHQAKGDLTEVSEKDKNFDPAGYTEIALSGHPYRQEMREGKELRYRKTLVWALASTSASDGPDCPFSECRPRLQSSKEETFEMGSTDARVRATNYGYDAEDNVIKDDISDNTKLLVTTNTDYYPNAEFKAGSQIRNRIKSRTVSADGTTWRKMVFEYDTAGNPVTEKHYADSGNSLVIKRTFGQYGNITLWTGSDGVTHTHTYDVDQVFPITESVTLPGGQILTTKRAYHRSTGKVTEEIGPHGVGGVMTFDDFGRPIEEALIAANTSKPKPLRNWSYEYLKNISLPGGSGTILKTQMWEDQPGFGMSKQQIAFTDGNGRTRQSCSLAENGAYRLVQSLTQNGGRTRMQAVPKYDYDGCQILSQLTGPFTVSTHDLFGRPTIIQPPAGDNTSPTAPTTLAYTTELGNLVRKTTLPNATTRTEKINALGQTIWISEGEGGTSASYQYAPTGELLSTFINGKEQMTVNYDWLGRKKTATDADMGAWSYDYDKLGRLKAQTDAKKQKIEFDYDTVGRVTEKRSIGASTTEKIEQYLYDVGAPGFDVLPGELSQVIEKTGGGGLVRESRFAYDASYRRMAKMQREISGLGAFNQTFLHNFKGQPTSTTYVGKKSLYYQYNAIGGLKSLCDTASCGGEVYYSINPQDGFDAYGALLKENFGNGVTSQNTYYPLSHRLQARSTSLKGKTYSKRDYSYNVMSSLNSATDPQNQLGSSVLSNVTYDGQDRLTGYQPKEGAAVAFKYASNGNILQNEQSYPGKTYVYGSSRPHAVTQIGDEQFVYDANGNTQTDANREMTYSAANQLTQVKMKNGAVVDMDYDFTSARVLKTATMKDTALKTWQTTTHYLGDALEIRLAPISPLPPGEGQGEGAKQDGVVLLHIYAGGDKVATQTLGKLSDVLAAQAAGTLWGVPYTQLPPLVAFSLLLAVLIMHLPFVRGGRPAQQGGWGRGLVSLRALHGRARQSRWSTVDIASAARQSSVSIALICLLLLQSPLALAGDASIPPISVSDTDYLVYYHSDPLGSDHLITEGKTKGKHAGITYLRGDVIQRFEYAPFGQEAFALNPNLAWDPAYTGQKYDIETGLYYYKARYYNPILGRFIQPDSLVQDTYDLQTWNRYAYVRNNPLKYVDPTGHVIVIDLSDNAREPSVSEQAAGLDYSNAPSFDSVSDIPDGFQGEAYIDGVAAYADFSSSGSPSGMGSSSDSNVDTIDQANDGVMSSSSGNQGVSQGSGHEEGGLPGAATDQSSNTSSLMTREEHISEALNTGRTVNEIIGIIGIGALMVAPPIGAAILAGSLIAGLALDFIDATYGTMTKQQLGISVASTVVTHYAGGAIAAKMGIKYGFHNSISRYYSKTNGQFVKGSAGRAGNFIEKLMGKSIKATTKWGLESAGGINED